MKKYLPTITISAIVLAVIVLVIVASMSKKSDSSLNPSTSPPAQLSDQDRQELKNGYATGNQSSNVVVTEFGDFQCPACAEYHSYISSQILPAYQDKIKLVFKNFPLDIHQNAMIGAEAAEAAGDQGKFWPMFDLLYNKQSDWSESQDPEPKLIDFASQIGIDANRFKSDVDAKKFQDKITSDQKFGVKLKIEGTPTFYINGVVVSPDGGPDGLKAAIAKAVGQ